METVLSVPKVLPRASSLPTILPQAAFAGVGQQFWLLEHSEWPCAAGAEGGQGSKGWGEGGQGQQVPLPTAGKTWGELFSSICSQRLLIKQSITEPEIPTKAAAFYFFQTHI